MIDAGIDEWLMFTGRLHPVVVHLPIGILFLACVFELLSMRQRFRYLSSILPIIWFMGAVFAVIACVSGLLLSNEGGYDDSLLTTHQWLGISVAIVSIAGFLIRTGFGEHMRLTIPIATTMILLITVTGHFGGSLTHGGDYLTEPLAEVMGFSAEPDLPPLERRVIENFEEAVIYDDVVYPILYDKCVKCHNSGKRKGKLNLATYEDMLTGGKSGETLVAGAPMMSELYKRIILPESDKKHMPPKNKPQLSKEEVNLIHWWISAADGSATLRLGEIGNREEIKSVLTTWYAGEAQVVDAPKPSGLPEISLPEIAEGTLEPLEKFGIVVSRVVNDKPFLSINCVNVPQLNDTDLQMLQPVQEHVVWLNASHTQITDSGMAAIGKMVNLSRLNLAYTGVSDSGILALKELRRLTHLNLVGTGVSDTAIPALAELHDLKALYLWKSGLSPKGVERLRSLLPQTEINAGEPDLP